MNKTTVIILALSLLTGCDSGNRSTVMGGNGDCFNRVVLSNGTLSPEYCEDNKPKRFFKNHVFEMQLPGEVFAFGDGDSISFNTNPTSNPNNSTDFHITQHLFEARTERCSYETTGIRIEDRKSIPESEGFWGYISLWDELGIEGFENYNALEKIKCQRNWPHEEEYVYAMCSEKDKKQW